MQRSVLERLVALRAAKRPVVLATDLTSGTQSLIDPAEPAEDSPLAAAAAQALRDDRGGVHETPEGTVFLNPFNPPLRLLLVGAVHIAQPLASIALVAGYDVTVVDPRRAFADTARFPGVTVLAEWPDEAMVTLAPDTRTAIVALTHDPKIDDPALSVALSGPAFYIGALGSKRTHARRLERLASHGVDAATLARIHGPVGLDIGARSPAEIAVSVLAQITAVLRLPA